MFIKKTEWLKLVSGLLLIAVLNTAAADDIDIYYGGGVSTPGSEPIVMFSLDYRPNLGSTVRCTSAGCQALITGGYLTPSYSYTFFDILRAVLRQVMEPLEGVRVGLMINHDYKNACAGKVTPGCSNGGYIAVGAKSFVAGDKNGAKKDFHNFLAAMPTPQGNQSHSYQGKELFFELYRYLTGQAVYNGHVGYLDFSTDPKENLDQDSKPIMWDRFAENGGKYVSPLDKLGLCSKIYTVNILFQVSQQEDDSDHEIRRSVGTGGMALNKPTFPQVISWLHDSDLADGGHGSVPNHDGVQNVTSYFIVDPTKINTKTRSYAQAGGTGQPLPLSEEPEDLIATLSEIFKQILSTSTTFVAPSIPVNVFNRAEVVDNVFLALFQPDADLKPFWFGNVKKLKFAGLAEGNPSLVDMDGKNAVAADGRLRYDVLSFWTDGPALPPADPDNNEVDGKDGRAVNRGGAGQKIPGYLYGSPGLSNFSFSGRRLFYDLGSSQLAAFNADLATSTDLQADLGAASVNEAAELIAWARGIDRLDEDQDGDIFDVRPWLMGDLLHSRPLPINFGATSGYSQSNPAIFLAVASNDGYLRLFRNTNPSGTESGAEVWGFMPRAVMKEVATLRDNAVSAPHPYMFDGSPAAYLGDLNGNGSIEPGEKAWLFNGLRRGGKAYYALDISSPYFPQLKWTIDKGGNFSELGMSFSTPRVIMNALSGTMKPALIFGGGYDQNKDLRAGVGTDDSEGNALYIVDAETGALIWKAVGGSGTSTSNTFYHAEFLDSVPSDISTLDSDGDGVHDRAYFGDTGGNIWRADFGGTDTSQWKLTLLAQLGRHASLSPSKSEDRRFFHRPDIVQASDEDGLYDAVVIVSGDRPDPKDAGGVVNNRAFMIKDRRVAPNTGTDSRLTEAELGDITNTCITPDGPCTADLQYGWRLDLEATGEKGLATPLTVFNTVYFTTYIPAGGTAEGSCSPDEGSGRLYAVALTNGSARNNYDTSTDDDNPVDELDRFVDLDSDGIPAEVVALPPNSILRPDLKVERINAPTRFSTYWFEEEDTDL